MYKSRYADDLATVRVFIIAFNKFQSIVMLLL